MNNKLQPDGIVRAIFPNGRIYEGLMTPNCQANDFGVEFGNYFRIGYWNKNYLEGNGIIMKKEANAPEEEGFYENGEIKAPNMRRDG